jgi:thiosulfate dehydrogenase [quinone] large subunit
MRRETLLVCRTGQPGSREPGEKPGQQIKSMNDSKSKDFGCGYFDSTLAFLILRFWLALRAIVTGIEKFSGYTTVQKPFVDPVTGLEDPSGALIEVKQKFYAMTNYSAIPQSLKDKFAAEPMLPSAATSPFYAVLGWALIVLGVMLLVGLGTRISLFLQGLLYTGLTAGLILIKQDDGVAWLGIHVALVALALVLAQHNRFSLLKRW